MAVAGIVVVSAGLSARTIDQRRVWQQDRIGQGVASGSLTPREATILERREGRLNREIRTERAFNGGFLTPGERAHVWRQENRFSGNIYRFMHNAYRGY
ncbi:MAG: hypothetical protein HY269_05885 [Deltaproteobacteria bacterium]|nr:hypothetical protein [Deltaproteobacteria bacterium]